MQESAQPERKPGDTIGTAEHTETHGDKVVGYKVLAEDQIAEIDTLKTIENAVGQAINALADNKDLSVPIDHVMLAEARQNLRVGFMLAVRSVARPESAL
jgi:hypothetical protein